MDRRLSRGPHDLSAFFDVSLDLLCIRDMQGRFIKASPDGASIRIIGYDWIEIFQDTTLLGHDIFGPDGTSRLRFDVVLVNPRSAVAIEKRAWEMLWTDSAGKHLYPEGASDVSMQRLSSKIETSVTVAQIFQKERPESFRLKLTPTMLTLSAIMRSDRVIGVLYAGPWKGGDSVIFEARRLGYSKVDKFGSPRRQIYGADLYGFIEGYWDALWQDPGWRRVEMRLKKESPVIRATRPGAAPRAGGGG